MTLTFKVKLALKLTKLQNISLKLSKLTLLNFTITLELFIGHLKVLDEFESSYLDLDLQICHESLNVCVII